MTSGDQLVPLLKPLADRIELLAHALLERAAPEADQDQELPGPLVSYSTQEEWIEAVRLWLPHAAELIAVAPRRDCPACGGAEHRFLFHSFDRFPYHECLACGTWFIPVEISRGMISAFLGREPRASALLASSLAHRTDEVRMESDKPRFREYFSNLAPFMQERPSPLYVDVGCGAGCSLMVAQEHGYRVLGIEEDENLVTWAGAHGLPMQSEPLPPDGADLISFWESLEHFPRPHESLRAVASRMGPDCILAMTVPNGSSLALKILRQDASWVNGGWGAVFGHMNLFSHDGIRALLDRAGLELLVLDSQYGSNLPELAAHVTGHHHGACDLFRAGTDLHPRTHASPTAALAFNALGPALSELERSLNLAPILIAVACVKGAREHWRDGVDGYWRIRNDAIVARIAANAPLSAAPDQGADLAEQVRTRDDQLAQLRLVAHDQTQRLTGLQAGVTQRDGMLEAVQERLVAERALVDALQVEVTTRDTLLADLQLQLEVQVGTTAAVQTEVARRDVLLTGLQGQHEAQAAATARAQAEVDRRDALLTGRAATAAAEIAQRDALLADLQGRLAALLATTAAVQAEVDRRDALLAGRTATAATEIAHRDVLLADLQERLAAQVATTAAVQAEVDRRDALLAERAGSVAAEIAHRDVLLADLQERLAAQVATTAAVQAEVDRRDALLAERAESVAAEIAHRDVLLADLQERLAAQVATTAAVQAEVDRRDSLLTERATVGAAEIARRDALLADLHVRLAAQVAATAADEATGRSDAPAGAPPTPADDPARRKPE